MTVEERGLEGAAVRAPSSDSRDRASALLPIERCGEPEPVPVEAPFKASAAWPRDTSMHKAETGITRRKGTAWWTNEILITNPSRRPFSAPAKLFGGTIRDRRPDETKQNKRN